LGAQLYQASRTGDVEAVKKLLARPDVDVNYAHKVRERVWAARRGGGSGMGRSDMGWR
jgi:hypothetical protein